MTVGACGGRVRIAILDDIHHAYEATNGVQRLRDRAEVQIFTKPFDDPHGGQSLTKLRCARLSHPAKSQGQASTFSIQSRFLRIILSPKYPTLF